MNECGKLPVFHDDQHGTAIVTLAGLINAVKVVEKDIKDCKVIINGAGAAGITIAKLLMDYGVKDMIVCDSKGAIYKGRKEGMNDAKRKIAEVTNLEGKKGKLGDVINDTDIFIGVSQEKALRGHWVSKMASKSIVFALANPVPEILPEDANVESIEMFAVVDIEQGEVGLKKRMSFVKRGQVYLNIESTILLALNLYTSF